MELLAKAIIASAVTLRVRAVVTCLYRLSYSTSRVERSDLRGHPFVFLLFITSLSLPGNVATQLPSFVSRITEVSNLSVPSGL